MAVAHHPICAYFGTGAHVDWWQLGMHVRLAWCKPKRLLLLFDLLRFLLYDFVFFLCMWRLDRTKQEPICRNILFDVALER